MFVQRALLLRPLHAFHLLAQRSELCLRPPRPVLPRVRLPAARLRLLLKTLKRGEAAVSVSAKSGEVAVSVSSKNFTLNID